MPSPGRSTTLRVPGGPGIRDDGGADEGGEVPIYYDPLISKLVALGEDRPEAIARMDRALREYEVLGIRTTVPFFRWMLAQPAFLDGNFHTGYLDELLQQRQGEPFIIPDEDSDEVAAIAAALHAVSREDTRPAANSAWTRGARLEALRG